MDWKKPRVELHKQSTFPAWRWCLASLLIISKPARDFHPAIWVVKYIYPKSKWWLFFSKWSCFFQNQLQCETVRPFLFGNLEHVPKKTSQNPHKSQTESPYSQSIHLEPRNKKQYDPCFGWLDPWNGAGQTLKIEVSWVLGIHLSTFVYNCIHLSCTYFLSPSKQPSIQTAFLLAPIVVVSSPRSPDVAITSRNIDLNLGRLLMASVFSWSYTSIKNWMGPYQRTPK